PYSADEAPQNRRDADGAARLDDELEPLEGEPHRLDDLLVGDGDDLVDEPRADLPREQARLRRLQAVRDRPRHVDPDTLVRGKRLPPVVTRRRLDTDHAAHAELACDRRAPRDQAAAAD